MLREARRITKQSLDMLDAEIKKVESINLEIMGGAEKVVASESVRVEPKSVELVASPVFDPKLNFWYTGTPPALEEPLVEINPQEEGGKMPWESNTTELSDNLVFDPKLNFWFTKRSNEQDDEARAAVTREKMEKEGRAILEEEKAKAKAEEEKRARAAASVYDQMRLKAIEDSKAEAAAKIKAVKEAKVMEELMKKKEELETKIGKNQTKPKTVAGAAEGVTVEACVMGQRELAKKKKEDMEKRSEEEGNDKKATSGSEGKEATDKKAFSLPMDDDSDDWMLDDDVGSMIEEEEEEDKSEKTKEKSANAEKVEEKVEEAKKVAFSLPMDDDSDDWMLDDDMGTMIDDEDEEENGTSNAAKEENVKEMDGKVEGGEKTNPDLTEKKSFALPLDDASDDWMIDDDVGTMIEEEEDEPDPVKEEKVPSSIEPKVETEVLEKKSFSLPLDDASDDWMLDDDVGMMVEEDDEEKAGSSKEESAKDEKEEGKPTSDHLVSDKNISVNKTTMEEKETTSQENDSIAEKKPIEKGEPQSQKKSKKNKNKKK